MKPILYLSALLAALALAGCGPSFKAGDCVKQKSDPEAEAWEQEDQFISRIDAVGKRKYKVMVNGTRSHTVFPLDLSFRIESFYERTPCPEALK